MFYRNQLQHHHQQQQRPSPSSYSLHYFVHLFPTFKGRGRNAKFGLTFTFECLWFPNGTTYRKSKTILYSADGWFSPMFSPNFVLFGPTTPSGRSGLCKKMFLASIFRPNSHLRRSPFDTEQHFRNLQRILTASPNVVHFGLSNCANK